MLLGCPVAKTLEVTLEVVPTELLVICPTVKNKY